MRFELVRKKTVGAGSTALEAGWSELQIVLRYAKNHGNNCSFKKECSTLTGNRVRFRTPEA